MLRNPSDRRHVVPFANPHPLCQATTTAPMYSFTEIGKFWVYVPPTANAGDVQFKWNIIILLRWWDGALSSGHIEPGHLGYSTHSPRELDILVASQPHRHISHCRFTASLRALDHRGDNRLHSRQVHESHDAFYRPRDRAAGT
eukprot:5473037-Prymnesium_polylepis.1